MAASCLAERAGRSTLAARHPLWRSVPPEGGLAGTLPMNLTTIGVGGRRFGEGAFDAIDHGLERDVAGEGIAALVVQLADGGADLVVGVGGDVFHEEVHQAGIALQDSEDLQGAVRGLGGRGGRSGGGFRGGGLGGRGLAARQVERRERVGGQRPVEQNVEEAAECKDKSQIMAPTFKDTGKRGRGRGWGQRARAGYEQALWLAPLPPKPPRDVAWIPEKRPRRQSASTAAGAAIPGPRRGRPVR